MRLNYIKGKLLEYAVRSVMERCGFSNVHSDGLFIYDRSPLQMIHGKGAAHDADILMEPPIQIPFAYPTRIIFECKAYARDVSMTIVRNALGLRNDINDFEIVTENTLLLRRNNRRADIAVHERKRHFYQVGVASIHGFTNPAIEFAANNKIPLFSLEAAYRGSNVIALLDSLPPNAIQLLPQPLFVTLNNFLSRKNPSSEETTQLLEAIGDSPIALILREIILHSSRIHVGVLESGELLFITRDPAFHAGFNQEDILNNRRGRSLVARIHWERPNRTFWSLEINGTPVSYSFYLPYSIAKSWAAFEESKAAALRIKAVQFSRIFVFSRAIGTQVPFNIITLDLPWIEQLERNIRE